MQDNGMRLSMRILRMFVSQISVGNETLLAFDNLGTSSENLT